MLFSYVSLSYTYIRGLYLRGYKRGIYTYLCREREREEEEEEKRELREVFNILLLMIHKYSKTSKTLLFSLYLPMRSGI